MKDQATYFANTVDNKRGNTANGDSWLQIAGREANIAKKEKMPAT